MQALVVPTGAEIDRRSDEQPIRLHRDMAWRKPRTDELRFLDVAQLSLAQRVVVQLNGVGVFGVDDKVRPGASGLPLFIYPI